MGKYWNTGLMSAYLVLAFAALLIVCHAQEEEPVDPVVNAGPLGDIRGVAGLTFINYKPRFEFLGIPYAKAPNEQDRFLVRYKFKRSFLFILYIKVLSCFLASGTYKRATASRR